MQFSSTVVRGVITEEGSNPVVGVPNVVVKLGSVQGHRFAVLGEAITAAKGAFSFDLAALPSISVGASRYEIRVFDRNVRLAAHGDTSWRRDVHPGPLSICVEPASSCPLPAVTLPSGVSSSDEVWGRVRHADGTTLSQLIVVIREVTMVGEVDIVTIQGDTFSDGWYSAPIAVPPANVVVKVFEESDPPGSPRLVGSSRTLFGATYPARIDVTVHDSGLRQATEWNRLDSALQPLLSGQGAGVLTTRQIAMLSGQSGWDAERVTLWSIALRLGGEFSADAQSIYGLMRMGFPRAGAALLGRPAAVIGPALTAAASRNIIAHSNAEASAVDTFKTALVNALKASWDNGRADSLGEVLRASAGTQEALTNDQVTDLISRYIDETGPEEAFWADLETQSTYFDTDSVAEARRLVTIGKLSLSFGPLAKSVVTTLGLAEPSVMATWSESQWSDVVSGVQLPSLPEGLPGAGESAQREALKGYLKEHVERAFPSRVAREGLVGTLDTSHDGRLFLEAYPDFDLATSRVDEPPFDGASEDRKKAARALQNLYRVAPKSSRASTIAALDGAGFSSARSISRMTRSRFVAKHTASLGVDVAEKVAESAMAVSAATSHMVVSTAPTVLGTSYDFMPVSDSASVISSMPDWETLFGNVDTCACDHCRSIHGPVAYFVDLMQWLENRPLEDGLDASHSVYATLYEALIARRPDLAHFELSCENAQRALPYIDLVLEVLEDIVDPTTGTGGDVSDSAAHDSEVLTPDMLAKPQYQADGAYTELASNTSRLGLPFHRPVAEARAFLEMMGVSRSELLRAFWSDTGTLTLDAVAQEQLGLDEAAWNAIRHPGTSGWPTDPSRLEADFWPVSMLGELISLPVLKRAGAGSWQSIREILHADYVNHRTWDGTAKTFWSRLTVTADDWCDFDTYQLRIVTSFDPYTLSDPQRLDWSRIRQFMRLRHALGWTAHELAKVLAALEVDDLTTDPWLHEVAALSRLHELTGIGVVELAGIVAAKMDTREDLPNALEPIPSLYDAVFLSPAVHVEGDTSYTEFALNDQRTEILGTATSLSTYESLVAGALGLSSDELAELQTAVGLSGATLSLGNLTTLHAWTTIAKVLGRSVADATALVAATTYGASGSGSAPGLQPRSSLAQLVELVEVSEHLKVAGLSVDEFRYLLEHESADTVGLTSESIQIGLGRLRDALRVAFESLGEGTTEASVREEVQNVLAEALGVDPDLIEALRDFDWSGSLPVLATPTDFTVAEDCSFDIGGASSTNLELASQTSVQFDTDVAGTGITAGTIATLTMDAMVDLRDSDVVLHQGATMTLNGDGTAVIAGGASWTVSTVELLSLVEVRYYDTSSSQYVTTSLPTDTQATLIHPVEYLSSGPLSGTLTFTSDLPTPDLLQRFLRSDFVAAGQALDSESPYEDIVEVDEGGLPTGYTDDYEVVRALHKIALIIGRLGFDEDERAFVLDSDRATNWQFAGLQDISGSQGAGFTFDELMSLLVLAEQRSRVPGSEPSFIELLDTAENDDAAFGAFSADLSSRTEWSSADISTLAQQSDAHPTTVSGLDAFLDRMLVSVKLGTDASTLTTWASAPSDVTGDNSAAVVSTARSKYATAEAWSSAARPVRDPLRQAQRDALLTYLFSVHQADPTIETADDLYQRYLIDVSMNPQLLTSRIVQASATIQLYVHRVMLGLERDAAGSMIFEPNDEDREQWEWMRNYRVWEAAYKVFLYPENWIEPELRDDKSPFFKDLERELAQGDINDGRVEQVVTEYLEKLREVSNLQVLAHTWQTEEISGADCINILHVFARSKSDPPSYWYRRFEDGQTWTAWEEIDCGVEGDHLAPIVAGRRLLLAWAVFGEASDGDTEESEAIMTVGIGWSEYANGAWKPKRVSDEVVLDWGAPTEHQTAVLTVAQSDDGSVVVRLGKQNWLDISHADADPATLYTRAVLTLDPCTNEMSGEAYSPGEDSWTRKGIADGRWSNPGYVTDDDVGDGDDFATSLTVYAAELEANTEPEDGIDSTEVLLLSTPGAITTVTPAASCSFLSQGPFFVQSAERCWFVVPQGIWVDVTTTVEGAIGTMGSWRRGTKVTPPGVPTPATEDDIAAARSYFSDRFVVDDDTADAMARGIDSTRIGAFEVTKTYQVGGNYYFRNFYHPHVCEFTKAIRRDGIFALLDPDVDGPESELSRQQITSDFDFNSLAPHSNYVYPDYPIEDVDFTPDGAYSIYNWELFFHVPTYVASRLMDNGRHEDAMRYLHTVFDPRVPDRDTVGGEDTSTRWWKAKPLMAAPSDPVTDWLAFVGADDGDYIAIAAFLNQLDKWRKDPFNPHLIARLREGTYQKFAVMRYLDNLIAWGDKLFRRDSLESLNEATQLYVFALQLLGERPERLDAFKEVAVKTYAELRTEADGADLFESYQVAPDSCTVGSSASMLLGNLNLVSYFCIPHNPNLLAYWDILEDRLFKIRNGLNIEGVARTLPLFEPPIDPAILVQAAAAGIDIGTALDDLSISLPSHRFQVLHGRATSLAASVRGLGGALLSALEKQDAEGLAQLRQEQEMALLDAVTEVREQQIEESKYALASLRKSKLTVKARKAYYDALLDRGLIGQETAAIELNKQSGQQQDISGTWSTIAGVAAIFPTLYIGKSPTLKAGGELLSAAARAVSSYHAGRASKLGREASELTVMAGYTRRAQEWAHQIKMADRELSQIEQSITAGEIRLEIARREKKNHELQRTHSEQVLGFMTGKFTNQDLYAWMVSQLAALYYQQYQLALATAKKAQACYRHELGRDDTFVQSVYWDGLRKGLLAGDRLAADLERMDIAFLERDVRELELTKPVSLARLDPLALARLREEGECYFELPEALFDLDCPGHYFRRLTSVAVSVSCTAGAQGQVNVRLTQHGSDIRTSASTDAGALEAQSTTYPSIVTSTAMQDAGVFNPDPGGAKYLPFERTGAVSRWHLAFSNQEYKQIDWSTVSDVVLHVRYTARDGGESFRSSVLTNLPSNLSSLALGFTDLGVSGTSTRYAVAISARRDAPDEWAAAMQSSSTSITVELGDTVLPYFAVGAAAAAVLSDVHIVAKTESGTVDIDAFASVGDSTAVASSSPVSAAWGSGDLVRAQATADTSWIAPSWPGAIRATFASAIIDSFEDIVFVLELSVS